MAFNVMAANYDDHTKNVAFLMGRSGQWMLAPAYDVTHAHNPDGLWTSQHLMSVDGKAKDITRTDMLRFADRFGIERAVTALDAVRDAVRSWSEFAARAGVPTDIVDRIGADLAS